MIFCIRLSWLSYFWFAVKWIIMDNSQTCIYFIVLKLLQSCVLHDFLDRSKKSIEQHFVSFWNATPPHFRQIITLGSRLNVTYYLFDLLSEISPVPGVACVFHLARERIRKRQYLKIESEVKQKPCFHSNQAFLDNRKKLKIYFWSESSTKKGRDTRRLKYVRLS